MVLEVGIRGCLGERKIEGQDLCDTLGMCSDRKERPQQVFFYRIVDETVRIGLVGEKERDMKSTYRLPWTDFHDNLLTIIFCKI